MNLLIRSPRDSVRRDFRARALAEAILHARSPALRQQSL